jgi:thiamine biosynthesis lipoprotein ApbE/Na+-translocating ferredoxin:NAD+ oxidoreductase RnfG subunit
VPREVCENAIEAAFNEIARLERLLSIYREDSEISRINRGEASCDPDVQEILALSKEYQKISQGAFDISQGTFPSQGALPRLFLQPQRGLYSRWGTVPQINLGAIGKGYAIDRAVVVLKRFGITCAKISCRSTIYGLGAPEGTSGWPVTIESPHGGESFPVLLRDQAISTSSHAEQFGHIINPKTGLPAEGTVSASVLSQSAAKSDALSTAAFVLGAQEGIKWLEAVSDAEGLIVSHEEKAMTSGWPMREGINRRAFLTRAAVFLLGIGLSLFLPRTGRTAVVYQTEDEALKNMIPDADRFDTKEIVLTGDQQLRAEEIAGKRFSDSGVRYNIAMKKEGIIGYGFPIEVIGKDRPITLLIGIAPDGKVIQVEVLIYRESRGSEVRYPRFMAQFQGKKKEAPLRMGDDIQSISGATLSSRGVTYGVRKALALFSIITEKK